MLRTLAIYKKGVPVIGATCLWEYSGTMPCAESQRCVLCGRK